DLRPSTPHLFLLPGPPRELHPMFFDSALPLLKKLASSTAASGFRLYRLAGITESVVEESIGEALLAIPGLELGYCARPGEVDVRCIGAAPQLENAHEIIVAKLGPHIASDDGRTLEEVVVEMLMARGQKLAV